MSNALHIIQGEHVRLLQGLPPGNDPKITAADLRSILSTSRLVICNASLAGPDLAIVRAAMPAGALLCGSINAHAAPTAGPDNVWFIDFRAQVASAVTSPTDPEYKLGLAAFETVVAVAESKTALFDRIYWDDLWMLMPAFIQAQWAARGTSAQIAARRWLAIRDHVLRTFTRPYVANIGTVDYGSVQVFHSTAIKRATLTIEAEHGSLSQIVRTLAARNDPYSTCWPASSGTSLVLAPAQTEVTDLVLRGAFLPVL